MHTKDSHGIKMSNHSDYCAIYLYHSPDYLIQLIMATHSNGQAIIFMPCGFLYLLILSIYLFFLT